MENYKWTGRSNIGTTILLLNMTTAAVCFVKIYFQILGVVSGNTDEDRGLPPNIRVSAFQSSATPTHTDHPFRILEDESVWPETTRKTREHKSPEVSTLTHCCHWTA